MKIFLSWSGDLSKKIALCFKDWLPQIVQRLDTPPFISDEIESGTNWSNRVFEELRQSDIIITFLTPENIHSPWVNFEAGVAANSSNSRVVAFLLYLQEEDLKNSPLQLYQNIEYDEEKIKKLFKEINDQLGNSKQDEKIVENNFKAFWPQFNRELKEITMGYETAKLKDSLVDLDQLQLCGLHNAFRIPAQDSVRLERVSTLIAEEKENGADAEFRLMASSGRSYLPPSGPVWSSGLFNAVCGGAKFTVILESPFSNFAVTRALANDLEFTHWKDKVQCLALSKVEKTYKNNLEIRVTDRAVNCSLFFTQQAVIFDPYLWLYPLPPGGRTENNFCVFEFSHSSRCDTGCKINHKCSIGNCYTVLDRHFEFISRTGKPFSQFLDETDFQQEEERFAERVRELKEQYKLNRDEQHDTI